VGDITKLKLEHIAWIYLEVRLQGNQEERVILSICFLIINTITDTFVGESIVISTDLTVISLEVLTAFRLHLVISSSGFPYKFPIV